MMARQLPAWEWVLILGVLLVDVIIVWVAVSGLMRIIG